MKLRTTIFSIILLTSCSSLFTSPQSTVETMPTTSPQSTVETMPTTMPTTVPAEAVTTPTAGEEPIADESRGTDISTWTEHHDTALGISVRYPDDGSYQIEAQSGCGLVAPEKHLGGFAMSQSYPGTRMYINVYADDSIIDCLKRGAGVTEESFTNTKTINGIEYQVYYDGPGMASSYGYLVERSGRFYDFKAMNNEEFFEQVMQTVRFDQ